MLAIYGEFTRFKQATHDGLINWFSYANKLFILTYHVFPYTEFHFVQKLLARKSKLQTTLYVL